MNTIKEIDYFDFVEEKLELNTKWKKVRFLKRAFLSTFRKGFWARLKTAKRDDMHSYIRSRLYRSKPKRLDRFLFREAIAITDCNPTGYILVDGQKCEAIAKGIISAGTKVKTYGQSMSRILICL